MSNKVNLIRQILILPLILVFFVSCSKKQEKVVVVYTSLDQVFSEPVIKDFEKDTGIKVKAVYDIEAAKTTGLVNRLIAEKSNPQADVFWNSEVGRTIILKKKGVLAPYDSPNAKDIPATFKDKQGYWTGFAARARVLILNTNLIMQDKKPQSIFDLVKPEWNGQVALANPLFGTTATHSAALFVELGDKKALEYFKALKDNGIQIVSGNSTSRDRVVAGELKIGFTDTDDVNVALEKGESVDMIFPDKDGMGTLFIPNTIAMISKCPHPEEAKIFIDYMLSKGTEEKLAFCGSLQIPLRSDVKRPENTPSFKDIKAMDVDYETIADNMERVGRILQELLLD